MRFLMLLAGAATVVALPAAAQDKGDHPSAPDCPAPMRHTVRTFSFRNTDDNRAVLGIGTTSGSLRDTLGLLVTDVTSGGPAEKAGIEEGDRLMAVDGTELRISAADASDQEMHGLMTRRLIRVLAKLKPGDVATLRVSSEGKVHEVKVTTAKASELFKDDGLMRLGDAWNDGPGIATLGRLELNVKDITKGALQKVREQLEHASVDLQGSTDDMSTLKVEVPDSDDDVQIIIPSDPSPPTAPEAPAAPTISRRFMRITAPTPPTPPTPPAPPAAPARPMAPSSDRAEVTI